MERQKPPLRNAPPTTEWPGRPVGYVRAPTPPAMRGGSMPQADGIPFMIIAGALLVGVAIGAKMAGGW